MDDRCSQHSVGPHGVLEVEIKAFGASRSGDAIDHGLGLRAVGAQLAGDPAGVVAVARRIGLCGARGGRVELERLPLHLYAVTVGELRQCLLKTALADVAPRADDVRPDLDLHALPPYDAALCR